MPRSTRAPGRTLLDSAMTDSTTKPARFGTDGIRGKAGTAPLDPPTLRRIGAALGAWLRQHAGPRPVVVLGHDGRESASWIRDALATGLANESVEASDLGLLTSPALAYSTRNQECDAGIMISASHNPASDNGIKIFGVDGTKIADEAEREIEIRAASCSIDEAETPCRESHDVLSHYHDFMVKTFAHLDLSGRVIAVDAANGGGAEIAPKVLETLGATVIATGCGPDGTNINSGVGALHPEALAQIVAKERAHLGICLDGDGDRGIFVDETGTIRDGDEVLFALASAFQRRGDLAGDTLVATVMSNLGLHRALEKCGVTVHTTPVGDRSVVQAMRSHGFSLGGEQSGHIIFAHPEHFTGDGLFTGLQLLSLEGALEAPSKLFDGFRRYPQVLINVRVSHKPDLSGLPSVQAAVADVEGELGRDGRVLLRYSGTEDLCRVMVEGPEQDVVDRHAQTIAEAVQTALS